MMDSCRVVLVGPRLAGHIGSAARVMRNFGASELVLVGPCADPLDEQARVLATYHGAPLLESCRIVQSLDAALADCVQVAGTSARIGGLFRRQTVGLPDAIAPLLVEALAAGPGAPVFGNETSGLSNEDVQRCHHLIHIPTEDSYPALNLAQAVAICLYEVRRAWLRQGQAAPVEEAAPFADQERMFDRLRDSLEAVRYLRGVRGEALLYALRHLIRRAPPTPMEVHLLLALAPQLRCEAERHD